MLHPGSAFIQALRDLLGDGARPVLDFFSDFGGPLGWEIGVALAFFLGGSRLGLRVGFSTWTAAISSSLLKWTIYQPRPYYADAGIEPLKASDGLGMPSGHAQGVTGLWGSLAWFLRRRWVLVLAIIFIVLTGTARIYYGVHSPAQVLSGWGIGLLCVFAVARLERPVVEWMSKRTLAGQIGAVLASSLFLALVGLGIAWGLRGDTVAPPEWESRWREAVAVVGEPEDLEEGFHLVEAGQVPGFVGLLLGFGLCGIWVLRTGEVRPSSNRQRALNVAIGMPTLAVFTILTFFDGPVGLALSFSSRVALPAVLGVVLPRWTGRFSGKSRGQNA